MPEIRTAAIALGSNLSSAAGARPEENLEAAIRALSAIGKVGAVSSFSTTSPVGFREQPDFVNGALLLETTLNPSELMGAMLEIERAMGRNRDKDTPAKGPRIIDLDLIFLDDLVVSRPEVLIPHPAMQQRRFVLEPLAEIAADWRHPVLGETVAELLRRVQDSVQASEISGIVG